MPESSQTAHESTDAPKSQTVPIKSLPKQQFTLCVPSSCISRSNCQNLQQVTHTAYQIAKAACTYNVGEVVVLEMPELLEVEGTKKKVFSQEDEEPKENKFNSDSLLLATLLQYFVTPPYLVKTTFDKKTLKNFEYAKKLPKISTLPFMQNNKVYDDYKEGLTVFKKPPARQKTASGKVKKTKKNNTTKFVNIGEDKLLELATEVPTSVRVTVNLKTKKVVSPLEAYGVIGAKSMFGYHVRVATTFTGVFTEAGYPDGYDQSIYVESGDYFSNKKTAADELSVIKPTPSAAHVLLVVSKWSDLEAAFEKVKAGLEGVQGPKDMFDGRLEVPAGVRVEDGSLIALTMLSN